jgi:hypothetical protein
MEDEGQALGRRQRVEHHEERGAHGVGQDRLVLRRVDDERRRRCAVAFGQCLPSRAGPQHVERDAGHDRRQPAAQVVDAVARCAGQPDPRLLHRVVSLTRRAEHPVGDGPQVGPVGVELLGQPLVGHARFLRGVGIVIPLTIQPGVEVTRRSRRWPLA